MNTRFSRVEALSVMLSIAALALPVPAVAQISDVPPVKMGLWQSEVTSTVTGLENTPMAAYAQSQSGRTHISQSCMTPESWKQDIQGFNEKQRNRNCSVANAHQDPDKITFDEVCDTGGGSKSEAHFTILIDNAEHAHGTGTMKIAEAQLPQPMTINTNIVAHFMSSDCGDVKPHEGKIIK